MTLKSFPTGLSLIAASLALCGCGLLGGNPTQGVGIKSKNCLQNANVTTQQCLAGSSLELTPNVPVFGSEFSDYCGNGISQTVGTVSSFGNNGDPAASTGWNGVLVVNNAEAPAYWKIFWLEPWSCGKAFSS